MCAQSCLTPCDPVDCSPPGSSVHGILQARMEWIAMSYSRGSSHPRDRTRTSWVSFTGTWILYYWATWEAHNYRWGLYALLMFNETWKEIVDRDTYIKSKHHFTFKMMNKKKFKIISVQFKIMYSINLIEQWFRCWYMVTVLGIWCSCFKKLHKFYAHSK